MVCCVGRMRRGGGPAVEDQVRHQEAAAEDQQRQGEPKHRPGSVHQITRYVVAAARQSTTEWSQPESALAVALAWRGRCSLKRRYHPMLNPPDPLAWLISDARVSSPAARVAPPAVAAVAVVAFGFWVAAASVSWFAWSLSRDLPEPRDLRSIGDMAQSTTLFDAHDRPAFTIYKEQRIEVPLKGFRRTWCGRSSRWRTSVTTSTGGSTRFACSGATLANLRQGRRAQGGSTITQQLARQSFLSSGQDLRAQIQGDARRSSARAHLLEEGDPGALFQQGVLRGWAVWCRSGITRIFRRSTRRIFRLTRRRCSPAS